jgi:hypothetical protein
MEKEIYPINTGREQINTEQFTTEENSTISILKREANLILPDKEDFSLLMLRLKTKHEVYKEQHPSIWARIKSYSELAIPATVLASIFVFIIVGNSITQTKKEINQNSISALQSPTTSMMKTMGAEIKRLEPSQATPRDVIETLQEANSEEHLIYQNNTEDYNISNWSGEMRNTIMTTQYENSF